MLLPEVENEKTFDYPTSSIQTALHMDTYLDKVGNVPGQLVSIHQANKSWRFIHGHLLDLSRVELLNLTHHTDVISGDEVDGDTLATETTTTTDSVDVVLAVGGKIVVDDQRNLLDIDTTGQKIGGDKDARRSGTELLHDQITLGLVHISVHGGDGEVTGSELLGEPINLSAGVAEDDGLGDSDSLVEIREGIELPLLLLNGNVELLDTLEGQLGLLDEDADGVAHELGGDLEDVLGHGGGKEDDLGGPREQLENIVDLLSETTLNQTLVGLTPYISPRVVLTDSISSASSRTKILMASVLRARRWIMSWTRPGVPTTQWTPSWRIFMSSRTTVPPMQAWHSTFMKSPMATTTF